MKRLAGVFMLLLVLPALGHAAELALAAAPGMFTRHYYNTQEVKDWQAGPVLYVALRAEDSRWSLMATALDFKADSVGQPCRAAGIGAAYDLVQWERARLSVGAAFGALYKPANGFNNELAGFPFITATVDVWRGAFVGALSTAFPAGGGGWVVGVAPMLGWRCNF